MKLNYNIILALAFGALANAAANKPIITSESPPVSIVTIPCNTSSAETTTVCHECPKTTAPPFSNTTSPATPTVAPPGTAPLTVPCIKCPESTAPPEVPLITITTTTFVTVPCSTEVVSVPSQPVAPPLNTTPTPVPALPSGLLVPSKAVPGGGVPGASTPAVPAPPAASSRPAVPPSPAPSPSGPPRPPAFIGAGSILSMNPHGTMMAIVIAALAVF